MNVSATTSQSLFSYQAALAAGGQSAAITQALDQTYASATSGSDGADPLTALAGEATYLGPLTASVYTQSQAQATSDTSGVQGLQLSQVAGGLDAASANALLASLSTSSPSGLQGFDNVVTGSTSLAAMAFQAQQAYGGGTLSADAQAASGLSPANPAGGSTQDAASSGTPNAAYVQQAVAASQQLSLNNTFTLLA